ncbi:MAG TPA: sensor histidine kinase [Myxococcota bacterium]|nr:sensor histidine kinase [Myxococcota bacterium]
MVLYGVVHRAYLQAVTLARTSAALESLNRELEVRADEQARDLRALAGEATHAREDERTRIARELHDELGQELTAARMALTLARRKHARDPDVLSQSLTELEALLARTAQTTRDLVSQLRPRAVEELGLGPAVERLVSELIDKTGVPIRCQVSGELGDLDPERRTAVYRFVQEGLTNALKHAKASALSVVLRGDSVVRCTIEDDGVGLRSERPTGHGLVGLRERALALGGTFELDRRAPPESGTRLVLTFPRTPT